MKEPILAFIDCINGHDVEKLGALMSDDHTFIDAHGSQVSGKDNMIPGWRGYFAWFPVLRSHSRSSSEIPSKALLWDGRPGP